MEFKDLVNKKREELNLTMAEVAKRTGVSKATVQRWESGEIKNVRRDKISKLAEALNTTPSYLMGWDIPEPRHTEFGDHLANLEYLKEKPDNLEIYKEICESDGLRILFDKARELRPEDIEMITSLIDKFKKEID